MFFSGFSRATIRVVEAIVGVGAFADDGVILDDEAAYAAVGMGEGGAARGEG